MFLNNPLSTSFSTSSIGFSSIYICANSCSFSGLRLSYLFASVHPKYQNTSYHLNRYSSHLIQAVKFVHGDSLSCFGYLTIIECRYVLENLNQQKKSQIPLLLDLYRLGILHWRSFLLTLLNYLPLCRHLLVHRCS